MRQSPEHKVQRDVEDFHLALDVPVCHTPAIRRPELRAELIAEEAIETVRAIERRDLVGSIDGMCDLLCVVYGTAAEFGIDLAPFWDEVHRTNMAKRGGPTRADGKKLKPDGWEPPDIAGILDDVRATAAYEEARDAE
jgi:predicted HAD superfamily Cof-like phosphohydrolase